ncbi:MAG: hypothetical protein ABFS37_05830, partial [Acidobacteriota bacterium]
MLMSDIFPLIEDYLCTAAVEISASSYEGLAEVGGNGSTISDQGETWQFIPRATNSSRETAAT